MHRRQIAHSLLAAAAILLAAGLTWGQNQPPEAPRNRIPLPIRMLSSMLVVLAALVLATGPNRSARLTAAGMSFGLLGDLLMARVIPVPQHVIAGMLAFGAGHVCYLNAGWQQSQRFGLQPTTRAAGIGLGWLAALLGWRGLAYTPTQPALLNRAALVYALLLGSMSGLTGAMAVADSRFRGLALGGSLFLLSDLILAGELFRGSYFAHIGDVIWLTYLSGQALIVDGLNASGAS